MCTILMKKSSEGIGGIDREKKSFNAKNDETVQISKQFQAISSSNKDQAFIETVMIRASKCRSIN